MRLDEMLWKIICYCLLSILKYKMFIVTAFGPLAVLGSWGDSGRCQRPALDHSRWLFHHESIRDQENFQKTIHGSSKNQAIEIRMTLNRWRCLCKEDGSLGENLGYAGFLEEGKWVLIFSVRVCAGQRNKTDSELKNKTMFKLLVKLKYCQPFPIEKSQICSYYKKYSIIIDYFK